MINLIVEEIKTLVEHLDNKNKCIISAGEAAAIVLDVCRDYITLSELQSENPSILVGMKLFVH